VQFIKVDKLGYAIGIKVTVKKTICAIIKAVKTCIQQIIVAAYNTRGTGAFLEFSSRKFFKNKNFFGIINISECFNISSEFLFIFIKYSFCAG
jgi:hypothetical protein